MVLRSKIDKNHIEQVYFDTITRKIRHFSDEVFAIFTHQLKKIRKMEFRKITGQTEIKKALITSVKENRISHAQLFIEQPGSGALALAIAYAESGRIDEALATHRRTLELAPDFPEANIALGDTLRRTGRIAEALNCYRFAISVAPDHAAAIAREAEALADLGQIDAAMERSKKAIGINASLPPPYRTIARSLARLGKHAEAFAIQTCALTLNGRDPDPAPCGRSRDRRSLGQLVRPTRGHLDERRPAVPHRELFRRRGGRDPPDRGRRRSRGRRPPGAASRGAGG